MICSTSEFLLNPVLNNGRTETPDLADLYSANHSAPRQLLERLWVDTDDRSRLVCIEQRLWPKRPGSSGPLRNWCGFVESVRPGNSHLTSSAYRERLEFPCAPFRYPAANVVHLSNNFLKVGHNFLGFVTGAI